MKLGAARVYDDVRMAAKMRSGHRYISTAWRDRPAPARISRPKRLASRALPRSVRHERALNDVGKSGEISLVYAGGIRNGGDVAKALALGADAVAIGTTAMIALNCNKDIPEADFEKEIGVEAGYCYHCHTGRCPVGVATQDPELRKRLDPDARRSGSTTFSTRSPWRRR